MGNSDFAFACPRCTIVLSHELRCPNCDTVFEVSGGIYRFLLPERSAEIFPFLTQYRSVREREGYRSYTTDEYRALPQIRAGHPQADVWNIRSKSFDRLRSLLNGQFLSILDLGAGNGWLSHRLTGLGHDLVAVDLLDDENDGLGAYHHYNIRYTCVQADFDALPFVRSQFDVVIFNASLHYARSVRETMCQACKMLKPGGRIFVMDSPIFSSDEGGRRMIQEQTEHFRKSHGLREVIHPGVGYLTTAGMIETGKTLEIDFRFYRSRGTFLWAVRRWWAGKKRRREPASFGVWAGQLSSQTLPRACE